MAQVQEERMTFDFEAPVYKRPRCMRERHSEIEIRYQAAE